MVYCQRTLGETFTGKDGQTDIVVRPTVDELRCHLLGSLQSIRFQIFGQHTGGNVYRQHDVDTFYFGILPVVGGLRTRQNENYHDDGHRSEHKRGMQQVDFPASGYLHIHAGGRDLKCGLSLLPPHHIPYYIRYEQYQQK